MRRIVNQASSIIITIREGGAAFGRPPSLILIQMLEAWLTILLIGFMSTLRSHHWGPSPGGVGLSPGGVGLSPGGIGLNPGGVGLSPGGSDPPPPTSPRREGLHGQERRGRGPRPEQNVHLPPPSKQFGIETRAPRSAAAAVAGPCPSSVKEARWRGRIHDHNAHNIIITMREGAAQGRPLPHFYPNVASIVVM